MKTAQDNGMVGTAQQPDLEHLMSEARQLWGLEPSAGRDEREHLLAELVDLDLDLERLALRATSSSLDDRDLDDLSECNERLGRLRRRWPATPTWLRIEEEAA